MILVIALTSCLMFFCWCLEVPFPARWENWTKPRERCRRAAARMTLKIPILGIMGLLKSTLFLFACRFLLPHVYIYIYIHVTCVCVIFWNLYVVMTYFDIFCIRQYAQIQSSKHFISSRWSETCKWRTFDQVKHRHEHVASHIPCTVVWNRQETCLE